MTDVSRESLRVGSCSYTRFQLFISGTGLSKRSNKVTIISFVTDSYDRSDRYFEGDRILPCGAPGTLQRIPCTAM